MREYARTKYACYYTYLAMSSVFSLPPLLFVTFREMYGVSYTLLGTLVLINFTTQMIVDLILTFFTRYFNIRTTIRVMPLLTTAGLLVYALVPMAAPEYAYLGLAAGTVIFSVAAGLCEVLLSPLVAALPSENPQKDMSMLHSLFAWGVVTVVLVSTAFFQLFGRENWMYLTMFWAALPVLSFVLFSVSPMPQVQIGQGESGQAAKAGRRGLALCAVCIFLGSAAENTMTNWISGYMENAVHLPKAMGDVLGMASYGILLGLARALYAKYGRNISAVLFFSMLGAMICYLVVALCGNVMISLAACVIMGLFTSMLWPGTLILMEEKSPAPGVTAYALMAACGDCGGSVAPQMLGAVVDAVSASGWALQLGSILHLSPEQVGMKMGMLSAAVFPMLGVGLLLYMKKYFRRTGV